MLRCATVKLETETQEFSGSLLAFPPQFTQGKSGNTTPPTRVDASADTRNSQEISSAYKVLVVDDYPANADLLKEIITFMGHQTSVAYSGAQALTCIEAQKPDLILLDIMMPEMSGYDVFDRLKQNPDTADILIIFVSALNQSEDIVRGLGKGAYDYITKPLKIEEVQARVSAALRTKNLQDELRQTLLETKKAKQTLEDFVFIASHDLQGPLRKIQHFNEFIRSELEGTASDELMSFIHGIRRNTESMEALLSNLLILSRIDQQGGAFRKINLNEVVKEVLSRKRETIRDTNARIEVDDSLGVIMGDWHQISHVFHILLDNALKFHRENVPPVIQIRSKILDNGLCEISVADNGIGFEEMYNARIFEPLQRLHGISLYPGSGMGLAILKKIVERHKGEISVQSKVGEGSVFTIRLPVS